MFFGAKVNKECKMKRIFLIVIVLTVYIFADSSRYVRDDEGIVTDTITGLQYQDVLADLRADGASVVPRRKWTEAIAYCENLTLGGYDDWRLPNYNELYFLADRELHKPAISGVFKNIDDDGYWTSTSFLPPDRDGAYVMFFNEGVMGDDKKTYTWNVMCVRGGE